MTQARRNKLAFSGGRTSGRMLRKLMDQYGTNFDKLFVVLFCNTGKEMDATLNLVHEVEQRWSVPITWLEYTRVPAVEVNPDIYPHSKSRKTVREQQAQGLTTHWFKIVTYATARRNGNPNTPFDELLGWSNVLPNLRNRMCSVQMKVRTMMRFMFTQGVYDWEDYIGIRADEAHRALEIQANCPKYIKPVFPLIEDGTTEPDVLKFWQNQPFDLQLPSHLGNCDLCYLKAKHKRVRVALEQPHLLQWWLDKETIFAQKPHITGDGKFFRKGEPYSLIQKLAQETNVIEQDTDIPCGCGDKGFVMAAHYSNGEMEQ